MISYLLFWTNIKEDEEKAKGFLGSADLNAGFLSRHFTIQDWLGYLALAKNMSVWTGKTLE